MVPPKKVESEDKPRYKSFGVFYYNDLNNVTKNIDKTLDDMIDNINKVIVLVKQQNKQSYSLQSLAVLNFKMKNWNYKNIF